MRLVFSILFGIAIAGLLASGFIHVLSFFRSTIVEGIGEVPALQLGIYVAGLPLLHIGTFVAGSPLIAIAVVSQLLNMHTTVGDHFFRALPKWMRYVGYSVSLYAMLIMVFFVFGFDEQDGDKIPAELATRGFSAVWMVFYAGLAGAYYSMSKVESILRRCECRKVCPLSDVFCGRCGKELRVDA